MTKFDPAAVNCRLTKARLTSAEIFWRGIQPWLVDQGYELRKRYRPDWVPSWLKYDSSPDRYEDGQVLPYDQIIDAVKLSDGSRVVLKRIKRTSRSNEHNMLMFFGTGSLASSSRNHCVPVLATLYPPSERSWIIVVMPLLREYDSPRFDTVGEAVECFRQIFEGLDFMHKQGVAHRDICIENIMVDARDLYPKGYHFVRKNESVDLKGRARYRTRTQKPAKYYIVGYEQAQHCDLDKFTEKLDPVRYRLESPTSHFLLDSEDTPDPFATDVFYIGNLIRYYFLDGHSIPNVTRKRKGSFEFMRPLIMAMTQEDYTKRPTMSQVNRAFEILVQGLSELTLRSRFSRPQDGVLSAVVYGVPHWLRKISFAVRRVPSLPKPRMDKVLKQDKKDALDAIMVNLAPSSVSSFKPVTR
ncbi:hypothetical protein JR316_0008518 [Psilocybe cubensis]|uniref:Protein kinase domain-containing protein n=3 Tax=Psilocybe cubensis TaxID=181762 RepID=A0A8H8CDC3_PSICU|nr:hypothetical protein JR316_0008481 [Psilocybe cubensis]XP_047747547.1 hypothetical protein JR316_0008518 [Psilocybe cubensis]KAH9479885.1 hypothetical protein JR316_0008481 [Psilocybe cubensis]KAH9479922.1 hypothetical protein JR316_0008518 [Psilocybe cubensis]